MRIMIFRLRWYLALWYPMMISSVIGQIYFLFMRVIFDNYMKKSLHKKWSCPLRVKSLIDSSAYNRKFVVITNQNILICVLKFITLWLAQIWQLPFLKSLFPFWTIFCYFWWSIYNDGMLHVLQDKLRQKSYIIFKLETCS